jgi:hypothetical protein
MVVDVSSDCSRSGNGFLSCWRVALDFAIALRMAASDAANVVTSSSNSLRAVSVSPRTVQSSYVMLAACGNDSGFRIENNRNLQTSKYLTKIDRPTVFLALHHSYKFTCRIHDNVAPLVRPHSKQRHRVVGG